MNGVLVRTIYKIYKFAFAYTWIALLIFAVVSYELIRLLNAQREIDSTLERVLSGERLPWHWSYYENFEFIFFVFAASFLLYLAIFTPLLYWQRYKLKRALKSQKYKWHKQGNQLTLRLTDASEASGYFLLGAQLHLESNTASRKVIGTSKVIHASHSESGFVFDLGRLPTGDYRLGKFELCLYDYWQVFFASFVGKEVTLEHILVHSQTEAKQQLDRSISVVEDSEDTILSTQASEGFYAIREFRRGDSTRRINWKHTAKQQSLAVRIPEESPISDRDTRIIVNLYTPLLNDYDYTQILGDYLNFVLEKIVSISASLPGRVILDLNSKTPYQIDDFKQVNPDKIPGLILPHATAQLLTSSDAFLAGLDQGENLIIFTLSLDIPSPKYTKNSQLYVYNTSHYFTKTKKQVLRGLFFSEDSNPYVNLANHIEISREILKFRQTSRRKLLKLARTNESGYEELV